MKNDQNLDFNFVSDLVEYDSETGNLFWKKDVARTAKKGSIAGIQRSDGYRRLKVGGRSVYAHRISWMLFYGVACDKEIDHINGDRSDNRIENLRECSKLQNSQNRRIGFRNNSGYVGVSFYKPNGKWQARTTINRKRISVGYFNNAYDANRARLEVKKKYHSFCPEVKDDKEVLRKIRSWSKSKYK